MRLIQRMRVGATERHVEIGYLSLVGLAQSRVLTFIVGIPIGRHGPLTGPGGAAGVGRSAAQTAQANQELDFTDRSSSPSLAHVAPGSTMSQYLRGMGLSRGPGGGFAGVYDNAREMRDKSTILLAMA